MKVIIFMFDYVCEGFYVEVAKRLIIRWGKKYQLRATTYPQLLARVVLLSLKIIYVRNTRNKLTRTDNG